MIRLIATDLDGTLLEADGTLPDGLFDVIGQLDAAGIRFAAASGRTLGNLQRLFAPVADRIDYVAENGAVNAVHGTVFDMSPIPRDMGREVLRDLSALGMRLLVSCRHSCFVTDEDRAYTDDIVYRLRNTVTVVDDLYHLPDEYLKLSGYLPGGVQDVAPGLIQKWGGRLTATVSGDEWFDLNMCNKGTGIRALSRKLDIPLEDIAAFGDQFNDESMLDIVGHPYVMESGNPGMHKPQYALCQKVLPVLTALLKA